MHKSFCMTAPGLRDVTPLAAICVLLAPFLVAQSPAPPAGGEADAFADRGRFRIDPGTADRLTRLGLGDAGEERDADAVDLSAPLELPPTTIRRSAPAGVGGADGSGALFGSGSDSWYLHLKGGPVWLYGDFKDMNTGGGVFVTAGYRVISFLSLELNSGYFEAERVGATPFDRVWGMPFTVGARASIPMFVIFDLYGGVALGGYHLEARQTGNGHDSAFVFGGEIFAGLQFELWKLFVSVEGRYLKPTDPSLFGSDRTFDALAGMVSIGVRF